MLLNKLQFMKNFLQKACPQYLKHSPYRRGFTLVEMLAIIAVVLIIVAIVSPQFSKIKNAQALKSAGGDIISSLNQAQAQTRASLNLTTYGVHFQSNQIIIFTGTSYSAGNGSNQAISIISPVAISNVTLNGVSGTSGDVYFNRLTGLPSVTGTVTVSIPSDGTQTKTITISATGEVSSN